MVEAEDLEVSKVWFLSGPMRGHENLNYDRFQLVADYIRSQGEEVMSPHEAYEGEQGRPLADYYLWNIPELAFAGDIVFLPGWQNSPGARIEYLIARQLGLTMHFAVIMRYPPADEYVFGVFEVDDRFAPVELEAGAIVRGGERENEYGHPREALQRVGSTWSALGLFPDSDPALVALAMASLKLSRLKDSRGHYDSIVDAIGYLIAYSRIVREA